MTPTPRFTDTPIFVEKNEKTYKFAQIQRKISILTLEWLSHYSLQNEWENSDASWKQFSRFFFTNWVYDPGLSEKVKKLVTLLRLNEKSPFLQ